MWWLYIKGERSLSYSSCLWLQQRSKQTAAYKKIERLYHKTVIPAIKEGLCGCVYTQLSDIENELNGLYTFDRQVCKVSHTKMLKIKTQIEQMIKK